MDATLNGGLTPRDDIAFSDLVKGHLNLFGSPILQVKPSSINSIQNSWLTADLDYLYYQQSDPARRHNVTFAETTPIYLRHSRHCLCTSEGLTNIWCSRPSGPSSKVEKRGGHAWFNEVMNVTRIMNDTHCTSVF